MGAIRKPSRVLVVGMDGLDPRRVRTMVREGRLPAFARLQQAGSLGALATSNPAESPVAWSSLATGCNPGRHGIFDFIHRNPKTYTPFLSTQREKGKPGLGKASDRFESPRRAPGFWRFASDAGVPTTVVRWPVTFPAENVTGNFLAGLGTPDVTGRLGKYTFYTTGPVKKGDEKAVPVRWRGNSINTHLLGPVMAGLTGSKPLRVKLDIERMDGRVRLSIGSQGEEIGVGQWSDWFKVTFKWGPARICDAVVKFHLVRVDPDLQLFATPMQIDPQSQVWPLTQPASYGRELADRVGTFYTLGLPEDTHAVTEDRYDLDAFVQQCTEISRQRRAMFEHELDRFDDGLLAFVFDAGDRIQHMFWCIDDPSSPTYDPHRAKQYAHIVDDLYREMDDVLGAALEAAGDDAVVFVVSDHGFGPFHRSVNLNRWLIDHGYMTLKSPGEGRTLLADVDWTRTRAYALGFTSVYLNLAGRESHGIVQPGPQAVGLTYELAGGLCQVYDTRNGASAIRMVYRGSDIYAGPCTTEGPDLVVGFEPGYRASWQTALGAAPTNVVVDNDSLWAADHLVDPSAVPGVLAANVPVASNNPEGLDLAPTVLHCLDLPVPSHMEGQSWLSSAEPPSRPCEDESSLELVAVGAEAADYALDGLDDAQRAQLEQHLSDLGYL